MAWRGSGKCSCRQPEEEFNSAAHNEPKAHHDQLAHVVRAYEPQRCLYLVRIFANKKAITEKEPPEPKDLSLYRMTDDMNSVVL